MDDEYYISFIENIDIFCILNYYDTGYKTSANQGGMPPSLYRPTTIGQIKIKIVC